MSYYLNALYFQQLVHENSLVMIAMRNATIRWIYGTLENFKHWQCTSTMKVMAFVFLSLTIFFYSFSIWVYYYKENISEQNAKSFAFFKLFLPLDNHWMSLLNKSLSTISMPHEHLTFLKKKPLVNNIWNSSI